MTPEQRFRVRIIAVLVLLVGALFIVRLYYLQVLHHEAYAKEAENQYVASMPNLYDRGTIYFREKDDALVAAATIASGYLLAISPTEIKDSERTFAALRDIIPDLSRDEFIAAAGKKDDPYEEVADRLGAEDAERIKALGLPGVRLYRKTWRTYPGGELAAQTVGFVAYQGDVLRGQYGLERYYDDVLERHSESLYINFFAELFSNLRDTVFEREKAEAGDLVLTIEPSVEAYLEGELSTIMKEYHPDAAGGVIMDPKTGAIRAMASIPTFDPNTFNSIKDPGVFQNPIVESQFEMGSIVKPLTVAAGLDAEVITAASTYNDTGSITLNKKTISNYDGMARGPGTTMQEVLNKSLNLGVAHIVSRLGKERFADYLLHRFHLGEETGIDLPGEVQGSVVNLNSKRDVEYATASFGQGIAVSPINITAALAILGNGGMTVTPHVVAEIHYKDGRKKVVTPTPGERAISMATSNEITRMLVTVVDRALLEGAVKIPEYSVAAKTGTAQMVRPRPEGGGYYDDRYLHTFFGYVPAYDPQFIVFLYATNPKREMYASHTLTHPFIRITKFLLNYYNVPPDRDPNAASRL